MRTPRFAPFTVLATLALTGGFVSHASAQAETPSPVWTDFAFEPLFRPSEGLCVVSEWAPPAEATSSCDEGDRVVVVLGHAFDGSPSGPSAGELLSVSYTRPQWLAAQPDAVTTALSELQTLQYIAPSE